MSRTIFAYSDAVMREDQYDGEFHQCSQAYGRTGIICKDEKRGTIAFQLTQSKSGGDRNHGMLTDAVMNIPGIVMSLFEATAPIDQGECSRVQIGRTTDHPGDFFCDRVQCFAA